MIKIPFRYRPIGRKCVLFKVIQIPELIYGSESKSRIGLNTFLEKTTDYIAQAIQQIFNIWLLLKKMSYKNVRNLP